MIRLNLIHLKLDLMSDYIRLPILDDLRDARQEHLTLGALYYRDPDYTEGIIATRAFFSSYDYKKPFLKTGTMFGDKQQKCPDPNRIDHVYTENLKKINTKKLKALNDLARMGRDRCGKFLQALNIESRQFVTMHRELLYLPEEAHNLINGVRMGSHRDSGLATLLGFEEDEEQDDSGLEIFVEGEDETLGRMLKVRRPKPGNMLLIVATELEDELNTKYKDGPRVIAPIHRPRGFTGFRKVSTTFNFGSKTSAIKGLFGSRARIKGMGKDLYEPPIK